MQRLCDARCQKHLGLLEALARIAADVRNHEQVVEAGRSDEHGVRAVDVRLAVENVERSTAYLSTLERSQERAVVDDTAARRVHEDGAALHGRERVSVDEVPRARRVSHVQRDHVAVGEQLIERCRAFIDDVRDASFFTTAEDDLTVKVWRAGKEIALTVTPGDHPTSAHASVQNMPRLQAIPTSSERVLPPAAPFNDGR